MTVYVDDMRRLAKLGRWAARWSHLMADTTEELMDFAHQLGCRDEWLQSAGTHREHFDIPEFRRVEALRMGAMPISYPHQTGVFLRSKRERMAS